MFLEATLATGYIHVAIKNWCHHSRFVSTFVVVSGGCRYFVKPSSVDVVNLKNICPETYPCMCGRGLKRRRRCGERAAFIISHVSHTLQRHIGATRTCTAARRCKLAWGWARVLQPCERSLLVESELGRYVGQRRRRRRRRKEGEKEKQQKEKEPHVISG